MNKNWFIAYANRDKYHPNGYAPVTIYDENGIITTIEEGSREKSLAIAQLIVSAVNSKTKNAAAPDLIEACKKALPYLERSAPIMYETISRTIAKAEGTEK